MSDQNNYQQGYPGQEYQQMNPQGYPQQGGEMYQQTGQVQGYQQVNPQQNYQQSYQQMNQQGYQQQGYQQMNPQGYPQQNGQMYQQSYQQPAGGGTKPPQGKKPKAGLIVGIVIAAIALIAGIILLIFKDKIFGSDADKTTEDITTEFTYEPTDETTEATTENAVEIEGGYDTPEDLISNFWESYENCDKDQMYQCFYLDDELGAASAESNYNNAVAKQDEIQVYYDELTATFEDGSVDLIADIGVTVVAVKVVHVEVPMLQIVDGDIYDINDIYDGTVFQLENGKWYMGDISETDVEIVGVTSGDTSDSGDTGSSSDNDEAMYLGYGDLKAMGDGICGYVDVPADWVIFQEIGGVDADYSYQMCSPDQAAIITMCAYDSDTSAYDAACNIYDAIAAEGIADEVVTAQVTIGGYEAYEVYAVYGSDYLVTYLFRAEDDRLHYVAVEMSGDLINIVFNVEGTFRFTE